MNIPLFLMLMPSVTQTTTQTDIMNGHHYCESYCLKANERKVQITLKNL